MQRILQQKFRRPVECVPLHPEEQKRKAQQESFQAKRRAPLQPGELDRRYYGNSNYGTSNPMSSNSYNGREINEGVARPPVVLPNVGPTSSSFIGPNQQPRSEPQFGAFGRTEHVAAPAYQHQPTPNGNFGQDPLPYPANGAFQQPIAPKNESAWERPQQMNARRRGQSATSQNDTLYRDSNDFDPTSFYGEEESDDEQQQNFGPLFGVPRLPHQQQRREAPISTAQTGNAGCAGFALAGGADQRSDLKSNAIGNSHSVGADQTSDPKSNEVDISRPVSNMEMTSSFSGTMSRTDLLKLFSMKSPAVSTAPCQDQPRGTSATQSLPNPLGAVSDSTRQVLSREDTSRNDSGFMSSLVQAESALDCEGEDTEEDDTENLDSDVHFTFATGPSSSDDEGEQESVGQREQ